MGLSKYQSSISTVAKILGIEKVNWGAATKACKAAMDQGFTLDDFVQAAEAMTSTDRKYWSLYSVYTKTDYWLSKKQDVTPKGVW